MTKKQLTREMLDLIHLTAATLVNDYVVMLSLLYGNEMRVRLPPDMPGGWVFPRVARGEIVGVEAVNALRNEILQLIGWFDRMDHYHEHDWANARGQEPVRWGGQLYASGYGALWEFFNSVKMVLCRCWATEEELRKLQESELDADLLDLHADAPALKDELYDIEKGSRSR
jgi:hypothetical protein